VSNSFNPKSIGDVGALGALNLGCSIVAPLIVFIVGGLFLDRYLGSTPLLTLIGVGLGLVGAGAQLFRLARYQSPRSKTGTAEIDSALGQRSRPDDKNGNGGEGVH
jgi:F0F1-type ATP synthase assembly protein I